MMDKLMRAMGRGGAGAGRGRVNPPTVGEMEEARRMREEEFEATPEEVRERKMRGRTDKAYEAARTTMKKGGVTRADGCVTKGHTKGKMI